MVVGGGSKECCWVRNVSFMSRHGEDGEMRRGGESAPPHNTPTALPPLSLLTVCSSRRKQCKKQVLFSSSQAMSQMQWWHGVMPVWPCHTTVTILPFCFGQ